MQRTLIMTLFLLAMPAGALHAGELRAVELSDGSVITGEVLSLSNGVYTIRTEALGTVRIDDARVRAIRSRDLDIASPPASASQSSAPNSQVRSIQEQLLSDQVTVDMIKSLKDNPDFRNILEDPEVMKAVNAGDIAALMANPKFQKVLQDPTVQDIQRKVMK